MKNFLAFTLAAGVAITTASVADAAGTNRASAKSEKGAAQATGRTVTPSVGISFDRNALNRELARLSDILQPSVGDENLLDEGSVGKKGAVWSF